MLVSSEAGLLLSGVPAFALDLAGVPVRGGTSLVLWCRVSMLLGITRPVLQRRVVVLRVEHLLPGFPGCPDAPRRPVHFCGSVFFEMVGTHPVSNGWASESVCHGARCGATGADWCAHSLSAFASLKASISVPGAAPRVSRYSVGDPGAAPRVSPG